MAMEIQTAEQIEEESIGGDSEVEVLEPLKGHIRSKGWVFCSAYTVTPILSIFCT